MSDAPVTEAPAILTPEDEEQYTLHDPREVRWLLQSLITARALISAHAMPGGLNSPTALLELYDDDTVLIDGNHSSVVNQRVLQAEYLMCVSQLERVRIQFRLHDLELVEVDGRAAFQAPMPEWMVRLQRRELFRLAIPPSHRVQCTVPVSDAPGLPEVSMDLRVLDISGGGLAMMLPDNHNAFHPKKRFTLCQLDLPDVGKIPVTLEVCYVSKLEQRPGHAIMRAGCRFVDLPFNLENQVLNYIFRTERARNARERERLL
ncbi:MAG: flagellar regulator YcgR PilZN domain-containing protein [Pseudoxanthomonas sp.]